MNILKSVLACVAVATLSYTAMAATPKTNDATASPTETKSTSRAELKWFHFTGNANSPSDLANQDKYVAEDDTVCPDNSQTYRCDIQILTDENDSSKPDLSQEIQDRTSRTSPTE